MKYNIRTFIQTPKIALKGEDPSGKVVIRVRWSGSNEVGLSTSLFANPTKWNKEAQLPKAGTTHVHLSQKTNAAEIRKTITSFGEAIEKAFNDFELQNVIPSPIELKSSVYKLLGLNVDEIISRKKRAREEVSLYVNSINLFENLDAFIKERKQAGNWSDGTYKKLSTIRKHLANFDSTLTFEKLTHRKLTEFQAYLIHVKHLRNVSIQDVFKKLRWFFHWCEIRDKELIKDKSIVDYRCTLRDIENKTVVFLDWNEFTRICKCYIPSSRKMLEKVRDVFIFQCATGLRYSDIFNLTREQIDGNTITIVTKKTGNVTKIDLNRFSKKVLDKYKDIVFEGNKALPVMSNQKMNVYLRELGQFARLDTPITIAYKSGDVETKLTEPKWKHLTTHTGRRTFVSIALAEGATPEEVCHITGHHSYSMLKRYIGISEKQRKHATAVFDETVERDRLMKRLYDMDIDSLKRVLAGMG